MNNIQKLIDILKLKISEAKINHSDSYRANNQSNADHWLGRMRAYEIIIDEAGLLLNTERRKNGEKCDKK